MKAIQFLGMTAFMAAMLTGCSNDSELAHSNFPADNIIRVTAGVNGAVTRAETLGTELNSNFKFSLTVINKASLGEEERYNKYTYGNRIFEKTGTGTEWSCRDILLWQDAETKVDVAALAPAIDKTTFSKSYDSWNEKITTMEYSITADQKTQSEANDLLYYYKSNMDPGKELKDGKLNIQFNHAFSMIDINVTLGTEYSNKDNPISEVIVGGSKLKATIDVANSEGYGVAYPSESGNNPETDIITTPGEFTMAETDHSTAKFSCILIPQKIDANKFKVTLKTSSKTYVWTSPVDITLETGHKYTLALTMGRDKLTAQKGNISAGSWTKGAGSGSTLGTK